MSRKYALGLDFGTESARAALVDLQTGDEVATHVHEYADGVIDDHLPDTDIKLAHDWALQNPDDWIESLKQAVPAVLREAKAAPEDIVGIGSDFTSCTMMPIDEQGQVLCQSRRWRETPHAWPKLWKHHAAQPEADKVNAVARQRKEKWLARYGGKISSEWLIPKIWQALDEAPEVYEEADRFIEGADWIVLQMTGDEKRNSCSAGYKAIWSKREGYPGSDYFKALDPRLENLVDDKLSRHIYPIGGKAGGLTAEAASWMGLRPGTPVAIGHVDAHVAVPASTVVEPAKLVMIMGTSICHMVCATEEMLVEGMCGVVEDGILPGLFGFEAGQSAVGDIFAWFVRNCVPPEYHEAAESRGITLHELLEEEAATYGPGETGLLALDWWNGNRSVLVDTALSGLLIGVTLETRPAAIYHALIEATAFGTRVIIEQLRDSGVPVEEIYACGGLPEKNPLLMQIYSDVTGLTMKVARSGQASALGAAMFGALAAGSAGGGFDDLKSAAAKMTGVREKEYRPNSKAHATYSRLYNEYKALHDYFGRGANDVMKRLRALRAEAVG